MSDGSSAIDAQPTGTTATWASSTLQGGHLLHAFQTVGEAARSWSEKHQGLNPWSTAYKQETSFNLSKPQFLHLDSGAENSTYFLGL